VFFALEAFNGWVLACGWAGGAVMPSWFDLPEIPIVAVSLTTTIFFSYVHHLVVCVSPTKVDDTICVILCRSVVFGGQHRDLEKSLGVRAKSLMSCKCNCYIGILICV